MRRTPTTSSASHPGLLLPAPLLLPLPQPVPLPKAMLFLLTPPMLAVEVDVRGTMVVADVCGRLLDADARGCELRFAPYAVDAVDGEPDGEGSRWTDGPLGESGMAPRVVVKLSVKRVCVHAPIPGARLSRLPALMTASIPTFSASRARSSSRRAASSCFMDGIVLLDLRDVN